MTGIKTKANTFNQIFAERCTRFNNNNKRNILNWIKKSRLDSLAFIADETFDIITALNIYKAHFYDDNSIRMIKICDRSILKPLNVIFQNSIKSSWYSHIWKISNIVPVHKESTKQLVKNYPPKSLLPIFGKVFEENYL